MSAGSWTAAWRRISASPHTPSAACAALAVLAAIQARVQAAGSAVTGPAGHGPGAGYLQLALVLLSLFTVLPLALVRSYPVTVALTMTTANVLSLVSLHSLTVAGAIAQLTMLYVLGRSGPQLLAAALALPFLLLALASPVRDGIVVTRGPALLLAAAGPLAAWAGAARRARRESLEHSETRQDMAGTLLEHTARGERARIARELHDVVAHHISMIAVQAETARLTTQGMPAAGAQRLASIGDTARTALTEMRRLLGVLREDIGAGPPDRQPQPGLAQLNELIDEARDASQAGVRLIISGWPMPLDTGVELAAYRIVQEALTNARRHAPGAAVDVELHFAPAALWLRVRDNGPGPPATLNGGTGTAGPAPGDDPAESNGLLGMRERAAAVGGTLQTGAAPGGGFLVEAELPAKADAERSR